MSKVELNSVPVRFDQEAHTYTDETTGQMYSGITGTLVHYLFPDKYDGIPKAVLDAAAKRGTALHEELELVESLGVDPVSDEARSYVEWRNDEGLRSVATEYTVSDFKQFATNIDVVFEGVSENGVILGDYKRTSKLYHESVSWQLSICAYLLEVCNPHVKVDGVMSIWFKDGKCVPSQEKLHSREEVERLIECYNSGTAYIEVDDDLESVLRQLSVLQREVRERSEKIDVLKASLMERMMGEDAWSYDRDYILVTRKKGSVRKSFDSKALKADDEETYNRYMKECRTAESLQITLRDACDN